MEDASYKSVKGNLTALAEHQVLIILLFSQQRRRSFITVAAGKLVTILNNHAMKPITSKFIYPIFLIFLLFFVVIFFALVAYILWQFFAVRAHKPATDNFVFYVAAPFIIVYAFLEAGHHCLILRYSLVFAADGLYLKDHLFFKKQNITGLVKGYSRTQFTIKEYGVTDFILYLQDGRKINIAKFINWNFKRLEEEFKNKNIILLGDEPLKWRNLIQRKYLFG